MRRRVRERAESPAAAAGSALHTFKASWLHNPTVRVRCGRIPFGRGMSCRLHFDCANGLASDLISIGGVKSRDRFLNAHDAARVFISLYKGAAPSLRHF